MAAIAVHTEGLRGEYEELADAAEDIGNLLDAAGGGRIDLTPLVRAWLAEQLACIEEVLIESAGGAGLNWY